MTQNGRVAVEAVLPRAAPHARVTNQLAGVQPIANLFERRNAVTRCGLELGGARRLHLFDAS